ncbi:hypothetical protein GcM3_115008, partial [Golovinomyces cichoracearum]
QIQTPKTSKALVKLKNRIKDLILIGGLLDGPPNPRFSRPSSTIENTFADRALLRNESSKLFSQKCENRVRAKCVATVVGAAKALDYNKFVACG